MTNATRATLYVMTGMSFAGKTTLARRIHSALGIPLVEPDAIAAEKGWHLAPGALSPEQWRALMDEGFARAGALLGAGRDVLFDTTATSPAKRDLFRRLAAGHGARARFIAVCVTPEEARRRWERNNETGERFKVSWEDFLACAREWVPPTAREGAAAGEEDENTLVYQAGEPIAPWIARHFGGALDGQVER